MRLLPVHVPLPSSVLEAAAAPPPSAALPDLKDAPRKTLTREGVPMYKQGDPRWSRVILESKKTIRQSGCALTATAMALSKLSGKQIDPKQLDAYLDSVKGYNDDGLYWDKAAAFAGADCSYVYS